MDKLKGLINDNENIRLRLGLGVGKQKLSKHLLTWADFPLK